MCMYFTICVCIYTHVYGNMDRDKIAKRLTIGEFGDGYVHCIVFLPFWKL